MALSSEANLECEVSNQDKIRYLKKYIILDREINRMLGEVEKWRGRLSNVTASYSSQPQGGGSIYGKTPDIIAKIVDLEQEINEQIDKLISVRIEIAGVIGAVEDDVLRQVLQFRYIDGKPWERVAADMGYSWRNIHRLHSKALNKVKLAHNGT